MISCSILDRHGHKIPQSAVRVHRTRGRARDIDEEFIRELCGRVHRAHAAERGGGMQHAFSDHRATVRCTVEFNESLFFGFWNYLGQPFNPIEKKSTVQRTVQ